MKVCKLISKVLIGAGVISLVFIVGGILHLVTSDEVAFWTAATALATCAVGFIAWFQIGEIKRQQQGWETLRACNLYDLDPTLDRAVCAMRAARKTNMPLKEVDLEITTVLNYFEGIAIGMQQGFYDPKIVRPHLGDLMKTHCDYYFSRSIAEEAGISVDDFGGVKELLAKWYP